MELVEPFPAWAWPLAWEWYRQSRLPDDFSPKTPEQFVELSSGRYTRTFGVIKDGLLGFVGSGNLVFGVVAKPEEL